MKTSLIREVQNSIADLDELIALKNEQGADTTELLNRKDDCNTKLAQARQHFEAELNNVTVYELPYNFLGYIYNPNPKYVNWATNALGQLEGSLNGLKKTKDELVENGFSTENIDNAIEQTTLNIDVVKNEVARFDHIQKMVESTKSNRGRVKGSKNAKAVETHENSVVPENNFEATAEAAPEAETPAMVTEPELLLVVTDSNVMAPKKVWSAPEEPESEPETKAEADAEVLPKTTQAKQKSKTATKKK